MVRDQARLTASSGAANHARWLVDAQERHRRVQQVRLRRWHVLAAIPLVMFVGLVHVIAVFLIVFALPIYPYKAYCSGDDILIRGPYRERFIVLLL
jgi:hypothetical protein